MLEKAFHLEKLNFDVLNFSRSGIYFCAVLIVVQNIDVNDKNLWENGSLLPHA